MRPESIRRRLGISAALTACVWAFAVASLSAADPPLQGSVSWLRDLSNGIVDPAYAAVDRCERLLGNAIEAWQLTPQNVRDCEAGRSKKSPIQDIDSQARSCWSTIDSIIQDLNSAYTQFQKADQLRNRPESKRPFAAGNALAEEAQKQLPALEDCVKRTRDRQDAAGQRLAAQITRQQRPSGQRPPSGGGDYQLPPGSILPWTRHYAGRWPDGVTLRPPGINVRKDWVPGPDMQNEFRIGRCFLTEGVAEADIDDYIACPGWPRGVRGADLLADRKFVCNNPSPPPFCKETQQSPSPRLAGRVERQSPPRSTPKDPDVLGVINDGRNFSLGFADGTKECLAQFGTIAKAVAQLAQSGKWAELDRILGIRQEGFGPVMQRWLGDIAYDAMHSLQEQQGLPASATAASQSDYQRGKLGGLRLCSFGAAGAAAKLAGHAVGAVGGPLVAKVAARARATAPPRIRLAATVAENVVNDVAAKADRVMTGDQQRQLVEVLAELNRVNAASLNGEKLTEALKGYKAMIAGILTKLEGDTLFLPGPRGAQPLKVTLGKVMGKGAFGWVFPIMENGQPSDKVIKILGNNISYWRAGYTDLPASTPALLDNLGGDSLLAQAKGAVILQRLGIPTPRIGYMHPAQKAGEFSFAIMDRIDVNAANIDVWKGTKFSMDAQRAAVIDLHRRLADAGYLAADLAPRNLYFTLQNGLVRAGVWDADLIIKAGTLDNEATNARFSGVLAGAAEKRNVPEIDYTDLLFEIDYQDAHQAMDIIQTIQWGPMH